MRAVLNDGNNGDVGEIDFDCAVVWERSKMRAAKRALNDLGAAWKQSGRGWLRIRLTPDAALFYAPNTGSLRFSGGKIFSSKGLPLAVAIVKAYR